MLQPVESWSIQDSTKIQSFMDCPRAYFYEYVLGWRPEAPNLHLEFGTAWHMAMEHLITANKRDGGRYSQEAVMEAHDLFLTHYRQFFPDMTDEINAPKNPANALRALIDYCNLYQAEVFDPLYTEIYGTVPIGDGDVLHFKMDSILKSDRGFMSREHKTGSQLSRQWIDQWSLKTQVGVYNHALYCLFPADEVFGVEINGTILQKKENKFQRIPVRKSKEAMQVWFWTVRHYLKLIKWEFERLMIDSKEGDSVLMAFPMNSENCTKYFGCRYHDFCGAWSNPLQHIDEVPMGMKIEHWNPKEEKAKAQQIFDLKQEEEVYE